MRLQDDTTRSERTSAHGPAEQVGPGRPVPDAPRIGRPGGGDGGGGAPPRPGAGTAGRPGMGWTELLVGAVLFVVFVLSTSFGWVLVSAVQGPEALPLVALTAASIAAAAVLAWSVRVRSLSAFGLRSTSVAWLLVAVVAGALTRLVTLGGSLGYQQIGGGVADPWSVLGGASGYVPSVGMLLVAGLLMPMASELLFRGIGYGGLRRYGIWVAAPVSALLFAATHGAGIAAVSALVLGIVTALLYERSGSLWPAVAAHTAFGLTGFAVATLF